VENSAQVDVAWKKTNDIVPAAWFYVKNSATATFHNVLITLSPDDGQFAMWCGDRTRQGKGFPDNPCEFLQKGIDKDYMCKHIAYVFDQTMTQETWRKEIEKQLKSKPVKKAVGSSEIMTVLPLGKPTLIFGPTGSGKTHVVREFLKTQPETRSVRINISDDFEGVDVLQKMFPGDDGKWIRIPGELRTAFDMAVNEKVIVVLEEFTRSKRSLRNILLKAMEVEDGFYMLHDFTKAQYIKVPKENLSFIATCNLGYSDTSALDPATARRFAFNVFHDYQVDEEKKILGGMVDEPVAKAIMSIAESIRNQYRNSDLPAPLDTGSLIEWAQAISDGLGFVLAAKLTWVNRILEKDSHGYPEQGQMEGIMLELEDVAGGL
jgi:MoxR-like ATPase